MQILNLEGVIYYADLKSVGSMGFLGGKERIRIPINSKHSSLKLLSTTSLSTLVRNLSPKSVV